MGAVLALYASYLARPVWQEPRLDFFAGGHYITVANLHLL